MNFSLSANMAGFCANNNIFTLSNLWQQIYHKGFLTIMYRVAVWTRYFRILSVYVHTSIIDEIPGSKKPMEIMLHSMEMKETVAIKCYCSSVNICCFSIVKYQ